MYLKDKEICLKYGIDKERITQKSYFDVSSEDTGIYVDLHYDENAETLIFCARYDDVYGVTAEDWRKAVETASELSRHFGITYRMRGTGIVA